MRLALETTQTLGEGAGVAAIAAASALRTELAGKRVVAVMSGGNVATETLVRVLAGSVGLPPPCSRGLSRTVGDCPARDPAGLFRTVGLSRP